MTQIWRAFSDLVLLGGLWAAVCGLGALIVANTRVASRASVREIVEWSALAAVAGFAVLVSIDPQPLTIEGGVDLVPFDSFSGSWVAQTLGNAAIFGGLGFFLSSVTVSTARWLMVGGAFVLSLELAQYVFALGRIPSVEDLLVGTVALGSGFALQRRIRQRRRRAERTVATASARSTTR